MYNKYTISITGNSVNQFAFEMWATHQSLWALIHQILSDYSYDSMTRVKNTHYKNYPPYMTRLTITLPFQPRTPFFTSPPITHYHPRNGKR